MFLLRKVLRLLAASLPAQSPGVIAAVIRVRVWRARTSLHPFYTHMDRVPIVGILPSPRRLSQKLNLNIFYSPQVISDLRRRDLAYLRSVFGRASARQAALTDQVGVPDTRHGGQSEEHREGSTHGESCPRACNPTNSEPDCATRCEGRTSYQCYRTWGGAIAHVQVGRAGRSCLGRTVVVGPVRVSCAYDASS